MSIFTYIASGKNGAIAEGEMETKDQAAVIAHLEKRELFPLSIKEKKKRARLSVQLGDRISLLDKISLTRNLALMIKAGIGIAEAVDILLEDAERKALARVLTRIKMDLEKGLPLSGAFAQFPRHFPPVFINLLAAGEASGNLEATLLQLSAQLKKESDLKKKVASAMAYPAILISLALGVVALLVTVVLPRVSKIFTQANIDLPLITRALLWISEFVTAHWIATLGIAALGIVLLVAARRSAAGRRVLEIIFAKIPVVSALLEKIALTRFTTTIHSLLKAGVPIIRALEITANSIGNAAYKKTILDMTRDEISKGVSFGMALKRRPEHFPRLAASMIMIGEKSGTLEYMLESLSAFYEEQVDTALKTFITILEPALLLGIGLLIGTLALSIIMPIYQMISAVG